MKNRTKVTEIVSLEGLSVDEADLIYKDIKKTRKFVGLKARLLLGRKLEVTYWVKEN